MIGKGVLLECLDHQKVEEVLVLGRSTAGISHPKLKEILLTDFENYTAIKHQLEGYNACYFCLGVSAAGMKESQYRKITYGYTLALAKVLLELNPEMTFTYVSGVGTDSTEKGRAMWARVKGKVENDLLKLGFKQAYMFRPGALIPMRGVKSRTKAYQFMYDYFMWLLKGIKVLAPNSICTTEQIGQAMINATLYGYDKKVLGPKDIIILSQK